MEGILTAERGCIYEWQNPNNSHFNYCLVISSMRRCRDKLISVLFLSTDRGDTAGDIVRIRLNDTTFVVHCDLITYTHRQYLTEKIARVDMTEVDRKIESALEIGSDGPDYKKMYTDLMDRMMK